MPAKVPNSVPPISTQWKWPTTKYVSDTWKSNGDAASMMPVRPPIRNIDKKPMQNSIGASNEILPPYIVASQLKNLMPVGTEISSVEATKKKFCVRVRP